MEAEITQLQSDILDQNALNNDQSSKMEHMERVMEDMIGRLAVLEDREN
jgi:hypothetical protein